MVAARVVWHARPSHTHAQGRKSRAWLPISDAIKIRTLVFRPEWT